MTESNKPMEGNSDTAQLFAYVKDVYISFKKSIVRSIAQIRTTFITNRTYFLSLMIIAPIATVIYAKTIERKLYSSSMIISSDYINMLIIDNMVDELNLLCEEDDRIGLSETLNIQPEIAKNIFGFSAKNFISENDKVEFEVLKEQLNNVAADKRDLVAKITDKIEISNVKSFQITVKVYDYGVIKLLDSAVVGYLRKNNYIKKRIESTRLSLLKKKSNFISQSNKLDSLKDVIYRNFESISKQTRTGSNNIILSDRTLTDPLSIFQEDLNLQREIRDIDALLFINPDFEVIDTFTTYREPSSLDLPQKILISIGIAILVGYISIWILRVNRYLASITSS